MRRPLPADLKKQQKTEVGKLRAKLADAVGDVRRRAAVAHGTVNEMSEKEIAAATAGFEQKRAGVVASIEAEAAKRRVAELANEDSPTRSLAKELA